MTEDTPIWISEYKVASGLAVISVDYNKERNIVVVFVKDVS
jgi:hypothetical protein